MFLGKWSIPSTFFPPIASWVFQLLICFCYLFLFLFKFIFKKCNRFYNTSRSKSIDSIAYSIETNRRSHRSIRVEKGLIQLNQFYAKMNWSTQNDPIKLTDTQVCYSGKPNFSMVLSLISKIWKWMHTCRYDSMVAMELFIFTPNLNFIPRLD